MDDSLLSRGRESKELSDTCHSHLYEEIERLRKMDGGWNLLLKQL